MTIPMGDFAGTPVQDASKPAFRLNERPIATVNVVGPNYFHTLQIPIRRGRDFTLQDKKETERVAIIDEAMARKFWPLYPNGLDPVGQHLFVGGINPQPARIVGIVATVRQNLENKAWPETVYMSFVQSPQSSVVLAIRSSGDPRPITAEVRKTLHDMDADLPLSEVRSMDDLMDLQLGRRKTVVDLLATFAAVALLLALVGLYGTLSYSVSQRVQELGIRSALGAQKGDIVRLVIGQGLLLTGIGIAIGMVASIWLTQTIQQLLFGVRGTDPVTFAGIGLMFAMAALLASYLPARRATQIDPVDALRV
jgi:predicted permease